MEEKCTRMVPLDAISIAETQTRERIRQSVVDEYAAMLGEGVEFDPGLVIADGQKLHLACGHHRYHAHKQAGKTEMRCEVRPGEVWDAIELGIKDNQRHKGALLTRADKRTAVRIVLKHQPGMSDRAIADLCEVTYKTVASVRGDLLSTEEIPQLNSRVGRDGRSRKIATGGNGDSASSLKPSFGEALSRIESDAGSQHKVADQGFSCPQQKLHYQALTSAQNVMGLLEDWKEKTKEGDQGWGP